LTGEIEVAEIYVGGVETGWCGRQGVQGQRDQIEHPLKQGLKLLIS